MVSQIKYYIVVVCIPAVLGLNLSGADHPLLLSHSKQPSRPPRNFQPLHDFGRCGSAH